MTNWLGFGFYIVSVLLTNVIVLGINANGSPSKYFITPSPPLKPLASQPTAAAPSKNSKVKTLGSTKQPLTIDPRSGSFSAKDVVSFLANGLTENAFSFILWWTFWFGIVHGMLMPERVLVLESSAILILTYVSNTTLLLLAKQCTTRYDQLPTQIQSFSHIRCVIRSGSLVSLSTRS